MGILWDQILLTQFEHWCCPSQSAIKHNPQSEFLPSYNDNKINHTESQHITANSKSPDMPIDNSHCSSGMSNALQTSALQLARVCVRNSKPSVIRNKKDHKNNTLRVLLSATESFSPTINSISLKSGSYKSVELNFCSCICWL